MTATSRRTFFGLLAAAPVVPFMEVEAPPTIEATIHIDARELADQTIRNIQQILSEQAFDTERRIVEGIRRGKYR